MLAAVSSATVHIDRTYGRFVARLPRSLVSEARDLPRMLGLSEHAKFPWSMVFDDPAMAELPLVLLGEAARPMAARTLEAASAAHLLAMIGAVCVERMRGRGSADPRLETLLAELHRARDEALARLRRRNEHPMTFAWSTSVTQRAATHEREVFEGGRAPSWTGYCRVSLDKQGLAFPASVIAAHVAEWSGEDECRVYDVIAGATLGLQIRGDVGSWMEDHERGVSWAVALSGRPHGLDVEATGRVLHERRILVRMLEMARDELRRAAQAAVGLGALQVAGWAANQAQLTDRLVRDELRDPGATVRWELHRRNTRVKRQEPRIAA